jgi:hypothetical protein
MADRAEMEAFWQRWLDANKACEAKRSWSDLADFFAPDATYGWNCGANDEFMTVGREEIREKAVGLEMEGLEGWSYPYQATLIDDRAEMIVGFWKQVADVLRPDGTPYEVAGFGASWFRYSPDGWVWQRDFFDHMNAGSLFFEMISAGVLSDGMRSRMDRAASGERLPGHYRRGDLPAPLWPPLP